MTRSCSPPLWLAALLCAGAVGCGDRSLLGMPGVDGSPVNADCTDNENCESGVCVDGVCQAASCDDEILNGDEIDVDCGGPRCPACEGAGQNCGLELCTDCCDGADANTCTDDDVLCTSFDTADCVEDDAPIVVTGTNPTCPACSTGFAGRKWNPGTLVLSCGAEGNSTNHCDVVGGFGALPAFAPNDTYCCISGCSSCEQFATPSLQAAVDAGSFSWTMAECL
jgi:hypothetical protein